MKFTGWMTASDAINNGFTHHGRYFGIPVWLAPENSSFPVAVKWAPMEYIMTVAMFVECTLRPVFFSGDDPCFQFTVLGKIKRDTRNNG
jgi:hypothetical protein